MADPKQGQAAYDIDRQQVGEVYAKALLAAAGDQAGEVVEQLDSLLDDVFAKLPELEPVLASPRVAHEEKERLLDQAFRGQMQPVLLNFLKVSSRRRRLDCLQAVRRAARELLNQLQGKVEVRVTTAAPVEAPLMENIRQRLSQQLGAEVVINADVDPAVLGGLIVRVGDKIFDGSIANRLSRVRQSALSGVAQTVRQSLERFVQ